MNKNHKELLKKKWYVQGFNSTPLLLIPAASSGFDMKKVLGINYEVFSFFFEGSSGTMFYSVHDLETIGNAVLKKIANNPDFLKRVREIKVSEINKASAFHKKIKSIQMVDVTSTHLLKYIKQSLYYVRYAVGVAHLIEGYVHVADPLIRNTLVEELANKKLASEYYVYFTTPKKKSFLQESEDLLLKIKKSKMNKKLIRQFLNKFGWIKNSYAGKHYFTEDEVVSLAKQISLPIGAQKTKKSVLTQKISVGLKKMIKDMSFVSEWQDKRKGNVLMHIDTLELLLTELSRRLRVSVSVLRFMLPHEIGNDLEDIKKIIPVLQKRSETSFFIAKEFDTQVLVGGKAKKLFSDLTSNSESNKTNLIYGDPASLGKTIGKVKICLSVESINEVSEGDILVASMTRPEYMSAMKKASAFVTDEGGITCHAAIVAREMRKPCIIGTKIATKVLKDGDLVEVDANHGVVKIL